MGEQVVAGRDLLVCGHLAVMFLAGPRVHCCAVIHEQEEETLSSFHVLG